MEKLCIRKYVVQDVGKKDINIRGFPCNRFILEQSWLLSAIVQINPGWNHRLGNQLICENKQKAVTYKAQMVYLVYFSDGSLVLYKIVLTKYFNLKCFRIVFFVLIISTWQYILGKTYSRKAGIFYTSWNWRV